MKTYPKEYIDSCRARVEADVAAYRSLIAGAPANEFESRFFNAQVLLLDHMFVHRLAGVEGKDGNPLNEVRALCNSLLLNGGKLQLEKLPGWPNSAGGSIKLPAAKSVLGLEPGDDVRLKEADFVRLAAAFFAEIEKRYQ
ncbi:MAG: hypothetical protein U0821_15420 [Chloroflexota bacterium]